MYSTEALGKTLIIIKMYYKMVKYHAFFLNKYTLNTLHVIEDSIGVAAARFEGIRNKLKLILHFRLSIVRIDGNIAKV